MTFLLKLAILISLVSACGVSSDSKSKSIPRAFGVMAKTAEEYVATWCDGDKVKTSLPDEHKKGC
jgi:hypothetical protein